MKCDELRVKRHIDEDTGIVFSFYGKSEVDAAIAELKQKLHDAEMQADLAECAVTEYKIDCDKLKDENRRLKRALWLARAKRAEGLFFYWCARLGFESGFTKADIRGYSVNTKRILRTIGEWIEYWKNVKSKCLKKAEEYK